MEANLGFVSSDCLRRSRTRYHLYVLRDPDTNQVRYVGCCEKPRARYLFHINGRNCRGKHVAAWIDSLVAAGKRPVMEVVCCCVGKANARRRERQLIREWLAVVGLALCNQHGVLDFVDVSRLEKSTRHLRGQIDRRARIAEERRQRERYHYFPPSGAKKYAYNGETLTLRQWANKLGISRQRLHQRLKKQPVEYALSRPKQTA